MRILYLLLPMMLGVVGLVLWGFIWAVRNGQFDDLEGPAHRILMDDDDPRIPPPPATAKADKALNK